MGCFFFLFFQDFSLKIDCKIRLSLPGGCVYFPPHSQPSQSPFSPQVPRGTPLAFPRLRDPIAAARSVVGRLSFVFAGLSPATKLSLSGHHSVLAGCFCSRSTLLSVGGKRPLLSHRRCCSPPNGNFPGPSSHFGSLAEDAVVAT